MIEYLASPEIWLSFATLALLEIVLGIDNLVFISVITEKLPEEKAKLARRVGLIGALVMRIALLFAVSWIIGLTATIVSLFGVAFSWRDIILMAGGLFLLYKGTSEIHDEVEAGEADNGGPVALGMAAAIAQIMVLDMVFSIDSVITAVGMTEELPVMIAAVTLAIVIMMFSAEPVAGFIERHPTTKMLALSFLLLIGVALVADGLGFHIPRGYLYFAIAFSLIVEILNLLRKRKRAKGTRMTQRRKEA